jgi:uncharacterized membrane protein
MSLEIALSENTSAIQRLAELFAAFMAGPAGTTAPAPTVDAKAAAAPKAAKTTEAPGKPEASKSTSQASPTTTPVAAPAAAAKADAVTYQMAREQVLKFAATHRDAIKAINTKHGIGKLSALLEDEADFFSVKDQAKLEAVYADLLALS